MRTWKRDSLAGEPLPVVFEQRMGEDHGVPGRVLALPVEEKRRVEPREQPGVARQHLVVRRVEAHDAAHAAFHRGVQAQERDVVRRAQVVAVVGVKALLGVGDVRPHAVARRAPEIAHVVDHLAVPALSHRAREELREEPVERLRFLDRVVVEGQPVDQHEADARFEHRLRPEHQPAAGGQLEGRRLEHERRQRICAQGTKRAVEFPAAIGIEVEHAVFRRERVAGPGDGPGERRLADAGGMRGGLGEDGSGHVVGGEAARIKRLR